MAKFWQLSLRPLPKFCSKVWKFFITQPFHLNQILFCFISFMNEIFYSAQISQLPNDGHTESIKGFLSCKLGSCLVLDKGLKWLTLKNTLAYHCKELITKVKFPGGNVTQLIFTSLLSPQQNKLERLSVQDLLAYMRQA